MSIAYVNGQVTALALRPVLLLPLSLGGCATSTAGSSLMDARAEAPASPKTSGYPRVEDLPPQREIMTADEQSKFKKELTAARDRQAASVKAQGGAAPAKPMKAKAVQPANQVVRQ
jgi:hypothetical protein